LFHFFLLPDPHLNDQADRCASLHGKAFPLQAWDAVFFQHFFAAETSLGVIAMTQTALAGFFLYQQVQGEGDVLTFAVDPAFQHQKVGQTLLQKALAQAKAAGVSKLVLEVAESNAIACHLYQKQGFQRIGRRPHYYTMEGGKREDALLFCRNFF
jgi:[ribosomal protein S18]-alanine N-acetyltransferase